MKKILIICALPFFLMVFSCKANKLGQPISTKVSTKTIIDKEKAIFIAKQDAILVYGPLDLYNVFAFDKRKVWKIVFKFKSRDYVGGAPEYLVDKSTGKIVKKIYTQ